VQRQRAEGNIEGVPRLLDGVEIAALQRKPSPRPGRSGALHAAKKRSSS
jgi:hypothetical protein